MDTLEIKASLQIDAEGSLSGIAWPFNAGPDQLGDVIDRNAFHVAVDDLPILLGHDVEAPVGIWSAVEEKDDGLHVAGTLFIGEHSRARAVRSLVQSGLISGLSIGYRTTAATPLANGRRIHSLDLFEVSLVRNPAHPRARVSSVKDATAAIAIAEAINRAAVALRTKGL